MTGDEVFLLCKKNLSDFKYILPDKIVSSKNFKYKKWAENQPTPTLDKDPKRTHSTGISTKSNVLLDDNQYFIIYKYITNTKLIILL